GYRYTLARKLPEKAFLHSQERLKGYYTKEYETEAGNFNVALVIQPDPFTELPLACIVDLPEKFRDRLMPHISQEGILCYVEQLEADWDPNNLEGTYKEVDAQIHRT
ncbi:E2/UBC family protein, partial [Escherichia coli]